MDTGGDEVLNYEQGMAVPEPDDRTSYVTYWPPEMDKRANSTAPNHLIAIRRWMDREQIGCTEIGRRLKINPASVRQWFQGVRPVPERHLQRLLVWAGARAR
jgi:hypothetical protein